MNNKELQQMRDAIEGLFPDTCNLLTKTSTSDGQGGYTHVWGTATADVACRLDYVTSPATESLTGSAVRSFKSYELALPYDTVITEAYRVEVNDITYNVTGIDPEQSWQMERICQLERV